MLYLSFQVFASDIKVLMGSCLVGLLALCSNEDSASREVSGSSAAHTLPAFYGSRKFITEFTTARHLFLFSATSFQVTPSYRSSYIHFNIILSSTRTTPHNSHMPRTLTSRLPQSHLSISAVSSPTGRSINVFKFCSTAGQVIASQLHSIQHSRPSQSVTNTS